MAAGKTAVVSIQDCTPHPLPAGHTPVFSVQENISHKILFSPAKPDVSPVFKCFCGHYRSLTAFDGDMHLNIPGSAVFGSLRLIHRRRAETIVYCSGLSLTPPETLRPVSLPYGDFQTVSSVPVPADGQIAIVPPTPAKPVKSLKRTGRASSPFRNPLCSPSLP